MFKNNEGFKWAKLPVHNKQNTLVEYCEKNKPVVLIDDIHAVTGRKKDLLSRIIPSAFVVVSTTLSEGRIPPTLRVSLVRRNPEYIDLKSDSTLDATAALTWLFALLALAMGAWPLAAALGGMRMLAHGRRATKQSD